MSGEGKEMAVPEVETENSARIFLAAVKKGLRSMNRPQGIVGQRKCYPAVGTRVPQTWQTQRCLEVDRTSCITALYQGSEYKDVYIGRHTGTTMSSGAD